MIRKDARLQYALLALIAALGLLHAGLGVLNSYSNLAHGTERVAAPFYNGTLAHVIHLTPSQARDIGVPTGFSELTITYATPAAQAAGIKAGDAILAIDGRPYTNLSVLFERMAQHVPGDLLAVTFWRAGTPADAAPIHTSIKLAAERQAPPPLWAWSLQIFFTALPIFCLLTGLYVVFARPLSPYAWMILGILSYFSALFLRPQSEHAGLRAMDYLWSTLAQTAMPLCFMLFGIYFPEQAKLDRRAPWVKWVVLVPVLGMLPLDLVYDYGFLFSFNSVAWLYPALSTISTVENLLSAFGIFYAFVCFWSKVYSPTIAADARRRLRVLIAGCSVGLTPFFGLLAFSMVRGTDLGGGVPQWVALSVFAILFIFPLTLAYVVVVQRAMDVRILLRQGTKYFFAKQSLLMLGILLATWMSYGISAAIVNRGHNRLVDMFQLFAIVGLFIAYRSIGAKRMQRWIDQKFFREAYSTEQLLAEISDEARNFVEAAPLLETICRRLGETLHIDRIAVFLRSGEMFQLQFATGVPMGVMFSLPANSTTITQLTRGKSSPAYVYREDPTSWLVDASDAERAALSDLSTELLVPLPGRNRLVGVIALGPKSSEEPYSKSDRHLLQTVASQTGLALENAELLENLTRELAQKASLNREIEIAREVQERLFPQAYPEVVGVDLAGYCRPAQFVGGDYYDFFLIPQPGEGPVSRLAIAIGDISGKGISAALLMASLRASLRSVATLQGGGDDRNLATLMQHVNRLVYEASTTNRYATFFYAELDPHTRVLTYVNAGHNSPAILRGGELIQLQPTGTVVGLLQDAVYEQASIQLAPGDTLLAFTDGISEAMTADDEEWGEERMIAAMQDLLDEPGCTYSAGQLLECLLGQADAFTAGAPQHDDMTLLICTLA